VIRASNVATLLLFDGPPASGGGLFLPRSLALVRTITIFFFFEKRIKNRFHRQRQTVGTISDMVTCRLVIRLVLPTLQNNKQLCWGMPTILLQCLSQ
jgi:hypothetical protein